MKILMAVYASSVIDAEDLTRRLPKMGAVKTNRRWIVSECNYKGSYAELEKEMRINGRILREIHIRTRRHEDFVNNRRKMHGQPLIRRVMS